MWRSAGLRAHEQVHFGSAVSIRAMCVENHGDGPVLGSDKLAGRAAKTVALRELRRTQLLVPENL